MTGDLLIQFLLRAQAATTVAILAILVLRLPARRLIGAELAYRLWAAAPVAAVVSLFPPMGAFHGAWAVGSMARGLDGQPPQTPYAWLWLSLWVAGGLALTGVMALSEASFRRRAALGLAGPAVMGVAWPRIVTPSDYAERFTAAERALIERHERMHIDRSHPHANLFIAAMQVIGWFNPLVHLAAVCARLDQELACDAAVIEAWPERRRDYGATLLKAHLARPRSPLACAWRATGRHPLEVRLSMLARPALSLPHYLRGAAGVGLIAAALAWVVWARL